MTKKKIPEKFKQETLEEWRRKNWGEMDNNLKKAIALRDDDKVSDQDRVRAIRVISSMLGADKAHKETTNGSGHMTNKFDMSKPPVLKKSVKDKLKALKSNDKPSVDTPTS